jgi:hypothetical protein
MLAELKLEGASGVVVGLVEYTSLFGCAYSGGVEVVTVGNPSTVTGMSEFL